MHKLLQIDTCLNNGSTGRITESIAKLAIADGWECYIMHSARYATPPSVMNAYQIGTKAHEYIHYIEGLLLDNHGLCSTADTKRAIKEIERIKPDVIQLHCIHGYFLNYKVLFEYLNSTNIPVVWTFHDCWAFTGHCAHFVTVGCAKWKNEGCHNCPIHKAYPKAYVDRSRRNFELKRQLFTNNKNLHIVTVSNWLMAMTSESFFSGYDIRTIYNGIDTNTFTYRDSDLRQHLGLQGKKVLLGVATAWSTSKGLNDYYELGKRLDDNYQIILVGLTQEQIDKLPDYIIGVRRTESVTELAQYYSMADIVMNLSYAETFGLTTVEGMACGTPGIVYDRTASPELVSDETGIVVPAGNIDRLLDAVYEICGKGKTHYSEACRERVLNMFDKNARFKDYINLYNKLISN